MVKLIRFLASFLLIPLILAFVHEGYLFLQANVRFDAISELVYGFVAYALLYVIALHDRLRFLEHFEHELGHALMGLLFFKRIDELLVNPQEGSNVKMHGTSGSNFLITLAPYFLPVFTLPLLILRLFVFTSLLGVVNFLIGVTLAFHYLGLAREFKREQPDIRDSGPVFSLLITVTMNVVFLVVILSAVLDDYQGIIDYLGRAFSRTIAYGQALINLLRNR